MIWLVVVQIVIAKRIQKVIIRAKCISVAALAYPTIVTAFQVSIKGNQMLRTGLIAYRNKAAKLTLDHLVLNSHQRHWVRFKTRQINIT